MSYVISTKQMSSGEKIGDLYIKGDYYSDRKSLLFLKGEVYNYDEVNELFDHIIQEGIGIIPKLKGEFFIVYYDNDLKKIYIGNDKLGRESLFYFYNEKDFVLSDDFWEIVNLVEPNTFDIDIQSVKESVVFHHPLFYKTIVKNLDFFPPASIGEYSLRDCTLRIKQYWDFKYEPNELLTFNEAADRLDHLFDNAMKQIKGRSVPNSIYGVGLSGGLDSRLVPYYALKHDMRLKSFIIGEKKPHKFLLSRDHKSAQELAKYYNLDHFEIEYDSEKFEDKSFYDVRYNPMGASTFFVAIQNKLPKFDILLTGTNGGELLGSVLPHNINKLSKKELLDAVIRTFSYMYTFKNRGFNRKLIKLLRLIFKRSCLQNNFNKRKSIDGIIKKDEFMHVEFKIREFIENNSDKSNIDIFQKYLFWHLVSRNKYGSFDTLYGSKKSYGIFTNPYIVEEALTWKSEFLLNKQLQNYFYIKKFPKLAKIPAQDSKLPILYRNNSSIFRKLLARTAFCIRGGGVMRYRDWALTKKYRKFSVKILENENGLFKSIFGIERIKKLDKEDMRIYENLVKIKQVLDLIKTKGYKRFFS